MEGDDLGPSFALEEAVALLRQYAWLAEFRIVDFYTAQFWTTCPDIPGAWRSYVATLSEEAYLEDLLKLTMLEGENEWEGGWPAAVQDFVSVCRQCSFQGQRPAVQTASPVVASPPAKPGRIRQKKSYELQVLTALLESLMRTHHLETAVDVGAGQGLQAMELLELDPTRTVYAVESADVQIHGTMTRLAARAHPDLAARLIVRPIHLEADRSASQFESDLFPAGGGRRCTALSNVFAACLWITLRVHAPSVCASG